jgi:hypothetical protein
MRHRGVVLRGVTYTAECDYVTPLAYPPTDGYS